MRILFLSAWFPHPVDNGSKIRISNLLRALARKHDVDLLSFVDSPPGPESARALASYCRLVGTVTRVPYRPRRLRALAGYFSPTPRSLVDTHCPEMARALSAQMAAHRYNLVIASEVGAAPYVAQLPSVPKVLEDVELGAIRTPAGSSPNGVARGRQWLTWYKTRRYLGRLIHRYTACTVVSRREFENVREVAPGFQRVEIIPNGVDVATMPLNGIRRPSNVLIFNGSLTYDANFDAAQYFLSEVWPLLKLKVPDVRLQITGRVDGVDASRLPLDEAVTLTGYLPDIHRAVAEAAVCVAPVRRGSGTRIKILEAMALGTPVVSTTKGAEGLDVIHGEHILVADSPADFAGQVARLLHDEPLRRHLAANGRRLVEQKYDWAALGEQFRRLVDSVAGG
jgi:glycosyltransferase involved in cell wall biosynthesis